MWPREGALVPVLLSTSGSSDFQYLFDNCPQPLHCNTCFFATAYSGHACKCPLSPTSTVGIEVFCHCRRLAHACECAGPIWRIEPAEPSSAKKKFKQASSYSYYSRDMIRRHISSNTKLAVSSRLDRFSRGDGGKERNRLHLQFYLAYPHGTCHISYIGRDDRLKETINWSYQPEGMRTSKNCACQLPQCIGEFGPPRQLPTRQKEGCR